MWLLKLVKHANYWENKDIGSWNMSLNETFNERYIDVCKSFIIDINGVFLFHQVFGKFGIKLRLALRQEFAPLLLDILYPPLIHLDYVD